MGWRVKPVPGVTAGQTNSSRYKLGVRLDEFLGTIDNRLFLEYGLGPCTFQSGLWFFVNSKVAGPQKLEGAWSRDPTSQLS